MPMQARLKGVSDCRYMLIHLHIYTFVATMAKEGGALNLDGGREKKLYISILG